MSQIPAFVELTDAVKETVKKTQEGGTIRQMVIDQLADQECQRRVDLLVKAMEARKAAAKELDKLRPDVKHVDDKGKTTYEAFTPAQQKNRQKAQQKLDKIDKALSKALTEANYDEVAKVASGKIEEDKPEEGGGDAEKSE